MPNDEFLEIVNLNKHITQDEMSNEEIAAVVRGYDVKEKDNDNDEEPEQVSYKEVKTAFVDFNAPYLESGEEQHID